MIDQGIEKDNLVVLRPVASPFNKDTTRAKRREIQRRFAELKVGTN